MWVQTGDPMGQRWATGAKNNASPITFGASYRYRVILNLSNGKVLLSNQVPVTIPPNVALTFSITSPERYVAVLQWNAMPLASAYDIWWKHFDVSRKMWLDDMIAEVPANSARIHTRTYYNATETEYYTLRVIYPGSVNAAALTKDASVTMHR